MKFLLALAVGVEPLAEIADALLERAFFERGKWEGLERTVKPTSPPTVEYALTDLGRELKPAIEAIVAVGRRLKERRAGK